MPLQRKHASLALVVLLTLTAGCSGIFGGTDAGASTATPADRNGPAPGTSGFDAAAIETGHFETLSNESFTASLSFRLSTVRDGENRSVFVNRTVAVDRANDRALATGALVRANGAELETTTYTADGTTAERRVLSTADRTATDYRYDTAPYDGAVRPVNASSVLDRSLVQSLGSDVNWTYAGTDTVGGDDVSRYEATGRNVTGFAADEAVAANVTEGESADSVSAAVLVDERGVVRSLQYSLTTERDGRPFTVTLTLSVSDVGETTVEEPDWLSKATA
ncbi:DUF7537 family lipoprotein [Haloarcula salina]|uniref:DUF7537 family lipoprotein n=1 Tax=Haloarcula salina TaxID=1429914 RepID=UPI003C6F7199